MMKVIKEQKMVHKIFTCDKCKETIETKDINILYPKGWSQFSAFMSTRYHICIVCTKDILETMQPLLTIPPELKTK